MAGGMKAWKEAGYGTVQASAGPTSALAERLYVANCSGCHQPDGTGIPGQVPPLKGDALVTHGDGSAMAHVVLNGRRAQRGDMPAFKGSLTDGEAAAILSFVRSRWGNRAPVVPPSVVQRVRLAR